MTGLFAHFFNIETTISERQFFKRLAQLIGTRSARLSACGIAAIASKMGYVEKVRSRHCYRRRIGLHSDFSVCRIVCRAVVLPRQFSRHGFTLKVSR